MHEKSKLEHENERLACQLIWLTGICHGVIDRRDTPPGVREVLQKALKVIGADKWGMLSTPDTSPPVA
jgi:hypothetical protein